MLQPAVLQKKPIETTFGVLEEPLGNTRLQVAKLLAGIISTNNADVMQELIALDTMQVLLDLFFKYQWNNFLHTQVEMCISAALKAPLVPQETGDCNALCRHVRSFLLLPKPGVYLAFVTDFSQMQVVRENFGCLERQRPAAVRFLNCVSVCCILMLRFL